MVKDKKFWIEISLSEETRERLKEIRELLYKVHLTALGCIDEYVTKHKKMPLSNAMLKEVRGLFSDEEMAALTYRTFSRQFDQTFSFYAQTVMMGKKLKYEQLIFIRNRDVWRKNLATGGGLTTKYGTLYLEGDWQQVLRDQAGRIPLDVFPFTWLGVAVRIVPEKNLWQVEFQHHSYGTKRYLAAKARLKETYG